MFTRRSKTAVGLGSAGGQDSSLVDQTSTQSAGTMEVRRS